MQAPDPLQRGLAMDCCRNGSCFCREKAPFVLVVETLAADGQNTIDAKAAATSSEGSPQPDETDDAQASRRPTSGQYADSVNSLLAGRLESHAAAGPGPGSPSRNTSPVRAGRTQHRRNDTASSRLPSPGSPATSVVIKENDSPAEQDFGQPLRSELTSKRSLSFSEALPIIDAGSQGNEVQQQTTPAKASQPSSHSNAGPSPRPSPRQLGRSPNSKGHNDDPLTRYRMRGHMRAVSCALILHARHSL